MKLEIWGSGGGECYPAHFCNCEHCEVARRTGGKSIRSLSQSCIDGELIVDFPPDTNMHLLKNNFSLGNVEHILITHAHSDHYDPILFNERGYPYAHNMKYKTVNVYGSSVVREKFEGIFKVFGIGDEIRAGVNNVDIFPYQSFNAGKYEITPLPASHTQELLPLNYIISDGNVACLYLLDTGYPKEEILTFLEKYQTRIGCVVMDATMGTTPLRAYSYHMSFADNIELKRELFGRGIADENTVFVATHITHNKAGTHEQIEEIYNGTGINVAYDGYSVTF